jgi:hypothetical protein
MSDNSFDFQRGIKVGSVSIDFTTGDISTYGNITNFYANTPYNSINAQRINTQQLYASDTSFGNVVFDLVIGNNVIVNSNVTVGDTLTASVVNGEFIGNAITQLGGTLTQAVQPNITSVGILSSLQVSGITTLTSASANDLTSGNISTPNINVTGGSLSNVTVDGLGAMFTSLQISGVATLSETQTSTEYAANFSSPNVQISGGAASLGSLSTTGLSANTGQIASLSSTTSTVQNFSTGNAQITGGAISGSTGSFTSLSASGALHITNATDSTGVGTGALIVDGGASIARDLYVGGTIYTANLTSINSTTLDVLDPLLYLTSNTTYPYNYDIGFYSHFVGGSANLYQHTGVVRNNADASWYFFSNAPEPLGSHIDLTNTAVILDSIVAGGLSLTNSTPSTSTTTGALIVTGGVGIQGALNATSLNTGSMFATSLFTQNFSTSNAQITGGAISGTPISGSTGSFTTLYGSDFSTGNAQITGGAIIGTPISGSIGAFTSINTPNLNATGGAVTGLSNLTTSLLQATDFSTGNAQITGGAISGTPISGSTGSFTTLSATSLTATGTDITTLYAQDFSTSNAQITGGSVSGTPISGSTGNFTGLSVSGASTLASLTASAGNFSGLLNAATGITASTVQAGTIGNVGTVLTGTLSTAAQPNITSVGTLTSLSVAGTITAGGKFLAAEGTGTNGGYSFTLDGAQDTGMFSPSDGNLQLYSNGADVVGIAGGAVSINWPVTVNSSLAATSLTDNGSRVMTSATVVAGTGLSGGGTISGPSGSITLTNTGVLSVASGTDISVSAATGAVTISDVSTLSSVTGRGATTNTALTLNGGFNAATSTINGVTYWNTAFTPNPASVDAEQVLIWSNSNNITGLSFSATDNRVFTVGVNVDNHVYFRAPQIDVLAGVMTVQDFLPQANLTYSIGSSTAWFNEFYGVATQALYADVAEKYVADRDYDVGTVLMFGGIAEVTEATTDSKRIAGVVSENPALLMNGGLNAPHSVKVALLGRVPCQVIGPIVKGDMLISAGKGYAKACDDPKVGQVIGKALENFTGVRGVIEVVVGRL